jgi:F-type H+-transporting ATPase subunit b
MSELISTFGINWKIMVIQIVNFGILLFALKHFVYGPVLHMLEKRRAAIEKGVQDAAHATEKLKLADGEGKALVTQATRDADDIIARSKTRAEEVGQTIARSVEEKAAAALRDAELRAKEIKEQALQESKAEIAQAAMLVAEKLLRGEKVKKSA